eukprot:Nk52_evm6s1315 gene=Nk52_evmTU6s1315
MFQAQIEAIKEKREGGRKCLARTGLLEFGGAEGESSPKQCPTPAFVLQTSRGAPPYITPDLLADALETSNSSSPIFQSSVLSLFEHHQGVETLRSFGKGAAEFWALPGSKCGQNKTTSGRKVPSPIVYCTVRDLLDESPRSGDAEFAAGEKSGAISVLTSNGRKKITSKEYVCNLVDQAMKPDLYSALPDNVFVQNPGEKRLQKSVDRTLRYLGECIQYEKDLREKGKVGARYLLAVVQGNSKDAERSRSLMETLKKIAEAPEGLIAGFAFEGFGLGEPASVREGQLRSCWDILSRANEGEKDSGASVVSSLLRVVHGMRSVHDVLGCIMEGGVDVFDAVYPITLAEMGCALVLPEGFSKAAHVSENEMWENWSFEGDTPLGSYILSLWDGNACAAAKEPISAGCSCLCCQRHTRAYVQHLLNTHEMLGPVLLSIHNLHWWTSFFKAIRFNIENGTFVNFCARWGYK